VGRLALVIVSHRHGDHFGGVPAVLRRYPVDRYVGNLADCPDRTTDNTIRGLLSSQNIPAQSLGADTLDVDGVRFITLPPDPTDDICPSRENNNSVLVRLEYGVFSMLFTGDAEVAERGWLVANHRALLDADVLKASHHGSDNGVLDAADDPGLWLGAVSPRHVVISAGVRADYGHPMPDAVVAYAAATGGRVPCTNRHRTVTVYGYLDGRVTVRRRLANTKSCAYDGTHY
jgi:beta-lactamase superfamily II metal-dependent hydrolase